MWTIAFWKDAAERAIRTFAGALAAALTAAGTGLIDSDWAGSLSTAAMAAIISLLLSVAGNGVVRNGTASFTNAVIPAPQQPTG
jgi:hypothetical protein